MLINSLHVASHQPVELQELSTRIEISARNFYLLSRSTHLTQLDLLQKREADELKPGTCTVLHRQERLDLSRHEKGRN